MPQFTLLATPLCRRSKRKWVPGSHFPHFHTIPSFLLGRPEQWFRKGLLCFTTLVIFLNARSPEVPRPIAAKFSHMIWSTFDCIIPSKSLEPAAPPKMRAKNMLNLAQVWRTRVWPLISPERIEIFNIDCNSSRVTRKSAVIFGPLTTAAFNFTQIAHTPPETEVPLTIFYKGGQKLA